MRVVLDTNILISAFLFPGGAPETVFRAALEGRITLVTSPPLLAELGKVLSEKFGWDARMVQEAIAQVARIGTVVRPTEKVEVIAEDPADDRVLEAAVTANATVIVSGDGHLLRLGTWRGIQIEKAASFLGRPEVV
ncbi:MAG: putative toxin-antitoxin system toxin component, PIN family [Actinomycetota bacterium]